MAEWMGSELQQNLGGMEQQQFSPDGSQQLFVQQGVDPTEGVGFLVPNDRVPKVVGKQGSGLKAIREASGQKVTLNPEDPSADAVDSGPNSGATLSRLTLTGGPEQIAVAFAVAVQRAYGDMPECMVNLRVPNEWAGRIIGKGGENIKRVRLGMGVNAQVAKETLINPATAIQERAVTLQGPTGSLAQALSALLSGGPDMRQGGQQFQGHQQGGGVASALAAALAPGPGAGPGADMSYMQQQQQHQQQMRGPSNGLQQAASVYGNAPGSPDPTEAQFSLAVPDTMVGAVVGKAGSVIKESMAKAGCRMKITNRDPGVGAEVPRRVTITGQLENCIVAQQILWEQLREAFIVQGHGEPSAFSITMWLRREICGAVIGKSGSVVAELRAQSGAQIRLADVEDSGMRPCQVEGPLMACLHAEQLIWQAAAQSPAADGSRGPGSMAFGAPGEAPMPKRRRFEDMPPSLLPPPDAMAQGSEQESRLLVPDVAIGLVIGKQGSKLKQIRDSCQAKVDVPPAEQTLMYPGERMVLVKGQTNQRCMAVEQIVKVTHLHSTMQTEMVSFKILVPSIKVANVVGDGGSILKWLHDNYQVRSVVSNEEIGGEHLFTITGTKPMVVEAAKQVVGLMDVDAEISAQNLAIQQGMPGMNDPNIVAPELENLAQQQLMQQVGQPGMQAYHQMDQQQFQPMQQQQFQPSPYDQYGAF